jgi:hypothetical protein
MHYLTGSGRALDFSAGVTRPYQLAANGGFLAARF